MRQYGVAIVGADGEHESSFSIKAASIEWDDTMLGLRDDQDQLIAAFPVRRVISVQSAEIPGASP